MPSPINTTRLVNSVNTFQGIGTGAKASAKLDTDRRYHRLSLTCSGVNYTNPTVAFASSPGGTPATFTAVVTNGVITAVNIATAGSGQTPGSYNLTITDPTGTGASATCVVAGGGTVTAQPVIVSGGTASLMNPANVIDEVRLVVDGRVIRDVSAQNIMKIAFANGMALRRGELPIYFTQPWRNSVVANTVSAWDMVGVGTFDLQIGIKSTVTSPSVSALSEFDYLRNTPLAEAVVDPKNIIIAPTRQRVYTKPLAAGRNDITDLPFANSKISRIWLQGATPGSIDRVEVVVDNATIFEGLISQQRPMLEAYDFNFGSPTWLNQNIGSSSTLQSAYATPEYFDHGIIFDVSNRLGNGITVMNNWDIRVYSTVSQSCSFLVESVSNSGNWAGQ